jgi:hypothetical protein
VDDEEIEAGIRQSLDVLGFHPQFLTYSELATTDTTTIRGKFIVLVLPDTAVKESKARGMVDGGLVKLLASYVWRGLVATREVDAPLNTTSVPTLDQMSKWASSSFRADTASKAWLNELLLAVLYRRHASSGKIRRFVSNSIWAQLAPWDAHSVAQASRDLQRRGLLTVASGNFTCSAAGRSVVERQIPFDEINTDDLPGEEEEDEAELWRRAREAELEAERTGYFQGLIEELVGRYGWVTVNDAAQAAWRANITFRPSLGKSRRFLEKLVSEGVLIKSAYNPGRGRPALVFRDSSPVETQGFLEEECGDCVFYSRVTRRCRLWWALSRFNAADVHAKKESLSPISRDKLNRANARMGPSATACEFFTPRKKDYPLLKASEVCNTCGSQIEPPVAKTVQCLKCGTSYKPFGDRILVHYDYEQVFRDRYSTLAGVQPPRQALSLPGKEYTERREWRDLVVLYPNEKVSLGEGGMRVTRAEKETVFEPYANIFRIVDYGALTERNAARLQAKGIPVVQRPLAGRRVEKLPLYPPAEFVEKLLWLAENSSLRRKLTESLMLSVIVATKRVADRGGSPLRLSVNRQLLEYRRMKAETALSLSKALAYEARVNNQYWNVYKTLLRASGLEFKSRVRDRFVREFVNSIRGRARGYSHANAGINYLHQRRLLQCRMVNARAGIGWIGCEGVVHVASRRPSIGLLLDLSDPFKLADRERFLDMSLRFEMSQEDFVSRLGRQRVWYFYPSRDGITKLDIIGEEADQLHVNCQGKDVALMKAYEHYVSSFVGAINAKSDDFHPFIYGTSEERGWLESNGVG